MLISIVNDWRRLILFNEIKETILRDIERFCRKFFKWLMQIMAKWTGIHHEIHLVMMKNKRRGDYGHDSI